MKEETASKVVEWIKTHHPADNRRKSIAAGLDMSIASVTLITEVLLAQGRIKKHTENYGRAFGFVIAEAENGKAQNKKG